MDQKHVLEVILEALAEWNQQTELEHQLDISPETRLLGASSKLDSLGLVNLIVIIEEHLSERFDKPITLADERAMSQEHSPFRSVQSLADYAYMLLEEGK